MLLKFTGCRALGGAGVERSASKQEVQGSNPVWGGLNLKQMFKPDPIDKMSPWWRSDRALAYQTEGSAFVPTSSTCFHGHI